MSARVYYHLSPIKGMSRLYPHWTDPEHSSPVEAKAQRICVSSSIIGCLRSIHPVDGEHLCVYSVIVDNDIQFIPNKYVQMLVPDADRTKESWVMQDILCLEEGEIEVTDSSPDNPKWRWLWKRR